jgi:hypothetical protein
MLASLKHVPSCAVNTAISITILSLKPLYEAFQQDKVIPKSEEYLAYEKKLKETYEELSRAEIKETKVKTAPKTQVFYTERGDEFKALDIDYNSPEVIMKRATIEGEFAKAIQERKDQLKDYNEWMDKECVANYELQKINISLMPKGDGDYKELFDAVQPMLDFGSPGTTTPEAKKKR